MYRRTVVVIDKRVICPSLDDCEMRFTGISVSLSNNDFCRVQKQKGKLVYRKSGIYQIWHIVSSVAQEHNVVNFHELACS